jgi:hypothetical protein
MAWLLAQQLMFGVAQRTGSFVWTDLSVVVVQLN